MELELDSFHGIMTLMTTTKPSSIHQLIEMFLFFKWIKWFYGRIKPLCIGFRSKVACIVRGDACDLNPL